MILERLSTGMTPAEIFADYEDLEAEGISAVLSFVDSLSPVKGTGFAENRYPKVSIFYKA
jgi:hypothetical protein